MGTRRDFPGEDEILSEVRYIPPRQAVSPLIAGLFIFVRFQKESSIPVKKVTETVIMERTFLVLLPFICIFSTLYAAQSTIVDVEGNACMGDDKSRKQAAMADAKRSAAERAMQKAVQAKDFADDPAAPFKRRLWTDKHLYRQGEKVRGITITGRQDKSSAAEFCEGAQSIQKSH